MPRAPEQEARYQALENQKRWWGRLGATANYTDAATAPFQAFVRGAAFLPAAYAQAIGSDIYKPERGDDTYQLRMAPWEAAVNRGLNFGAEVAGSTYAMGPAVGALGKTLSMPKVMKYVGLGYGVNAPTTAAAAAKKIIEWPWKYRVAMALMSPFAAYETAGYGTESWQDYVNNRERDEYQEVQREYQEAQRSYEEVKAFAEAAHKKLGEYKKVIGESDAEQRQRAQTFLDDLGAGASRSRWYKQPAGASLLGAGTGAALGYGISSFMTKDKVNRLLSTLAGGGAGAVIGHMAGEQTQKAADKATARAYMYAKALSAYRGM